MSDTGDSKGRVHFILPTFKLLADCSWKQNAGSDRPIDVFFKALDDSTES